MFLFYSVVFGVASMISFGLSMAYSRPLAEAYGSAQVVFVRGLVATIMFGIIASGCNYDNSHNMMAELMAVLLGILGYIPSLSFTHAVKTSRIGIIAPIAGTAPLVTVLLSSWLLGVKIENYQWIAIIFIVLSNMAVSFNFNNWLDSNMFNLSSGIPFAMVSALGWGVFYFFLIPLTKEVGPFLSAFLSELGVVMAAGAHILIAKKRCSILSFKAPSIWMNGSLIFIGTLAFTFGVKHFNVAIVSTLSNSVAVISTLIGTFHFRERFQLKEKIASAVMILGIAVISS